MSADAPARRGARAVKRLVNINGQQAVIDRLLKANPALGQNFVAMDPLEWLARMTDHIPDSGRHRTLSYAHYANRARGARGKEKALLDAGQAEAPKKRRCSPNWARLISKVYHADPTQRRGPCESRCLWVGCSTRSRHRTRQSRRTALH